MSKIPFYSRTGKRKNDTKFGRKSETRTAKRLGATLHAGSGNLGVKADFTVREFKIENKSTIHDSMKLELHWLFKVYQEAFEVDKIPSLAIQFVDNEGKVRKRGNWVMLPESVYADLIRYMKEEE